MTAPGNHDLETLLRSALQAEVGSVEPAPGGLERINSRLRRPLPLPLAWLVQAWTYLAMRIPDEAGGLGGWLKVAGRGLVRGIPALAAAGWRYTLAAYRTVERFVPGPANRHARPSRLRFLRPIAVMTFAIGVLAAGVYAGFDVSQGFSPTFGIGGLLNPGPSHQSSTGPRPEGSGTPSSSAGYSSGSSSGSPSPSTSTCKTKKSSKKSKAKTSTCKSTSESSPAVPAVPAVSTPTSESSSSSTGTPTSPTTSTSTSPSPTPTPSDSSSATAGSTATAGTTGS